MTTTTRPMLDEAALRRPDALLETSVPVRLGDGGDWLIPKPRIHYKPVGNELGYEITMMLGGEGFDGEFGRRYRAFEDARRRANDPDAAEGERDRFYDRLPGLRLGIYRAMLDRNYTLDDDQAQLLLTLELNGDADRELWMLATGQSGPKPSTAGETLDASLAV